jgi:hypothetical protein
VLCLCVSLRRGTCQFYSRRGQDLHGIGHASRWHLAPTSSPFGVVRLTSNDGEKESQDPRVTASEDVWMWMRVAEASRLLGRRCGAARKDVAWIEGTGGRMRRVTLMRVYGCMLECGVIQMRVLFGGPKRKDVAWNVILPRRPVASSTRQLTIRSGVLELQWQRDGKPESSHMNLHPL